MDFQKLIEGSRYKDLAILKEEISQVMLDKRYKTEIFTNFTFNGFYRARVHNHLEGNFDKNGVLHKFTNETEFWNPPSSNVKMGRCNADGESIFYCSSDFVTAVLEVKPKVGDYITVVNFKSFYIEEVPQFRINPIGKNYLMKISSLQNLFGGYVLDEGQNEIESFLDELFHQNVDENDIYKYKLSVAISHIFMTDGTNIKKDIFKTDGLLYPSIVRNQESYCFALKPWWVHCFFKISTIQTIQIIEKGNDFLKLKLLRNGWVKGEKIYPADLFDIEWMTPPIRLENTERIEF
ncbi:RES domain-containing protein [Flavobacterium palustre]|nr:RES domain-containing protein [Flavobacterium palustre]